MTSILVAAAGALVGLGAFVVYQTVRGISVLPTRDPSDPQRRVTSRAALWIMAAAFGLVVLVGTGWPVAAVAAGAAVVAAPSFVSSNRMARRKADEAEAVASWTEMLRDTMAASTGLGQAVTETAALAPASLRHALIPFAARLRAHQPLTEALDQLSRDLDNPAADRLILALAAADRLEVRQVGPLLGRLAEATRADVGMRHRVEIPRARLRTSARIILATSGILFFGLVVFAPHLLTVYDTPGGQVWLAVVVGVVVLAGWLFARNARMDPLPRVRLRIPPEKEGVDR